jgi:hypothetical protein
MSGKKLLAVMAALMLIMAACGDDDDASSTDTSVSEEVDTPQLTFDGTDCTYAGPAEVTEGVVVVEFVNTIDANAEGVTLAGLAVLKIDEGYTVDDVVESFDDPGQAFPVWLSDMGSAIPADAGETTAWEGNLDAGEYALLCQQHALVPWFGSGLTVVEG